MGGDNQFQYAPNPIKWIDPLGLFVFALPAIGLAFEGLGSLAAAVVGAGSIITVLSIPGDTSDNAPPVEWPKKKPGKYVCHCRAKGTNCEGKRAFGFGVGVDSSFNKALAIAKKMAVSNVPEGFGNIHHTACKCTGPKGERITPHKG